MRAPSILLSLAFLAACGGDGKSGGGAGAGGDAQTWADADGDTIIDLHEGYVDERSGEESLDSDGDGTADYLDTDSDDDGIEDAIEAGDVDILTLPWDSDADTLPDVLDDDSDGNCLADATEGGLSDLDADGLPDFQDLDDDGDNLLDLVEMDECSLPDSDGDGDADFQDLDSDDDGVGDLYEGGTSAWETTPRDADGDGTPDYLDDDSDGDGLSDTQEGGTSAPDQEPRDTDGDGIYDFADTDSDGDGIADDVEVSRGLDPRDPDSDGDGFTDGAEDAAGTDPTDAGSVIDGIYVTVPERENVEQSFDFTLSVQMGDVVFMLDTTGSMTTTLNGMSSQFNSILSQLTSTLPDAAYGVATYDDYAYGGYGTAGVDKPFWLQQQVTTDSARVQSTLSGLRVHSGNDTPESTMEALYQALSGAGYDQNCNGRYDTNTDLKPFHASSGDPFGGAGGENYNSSTVGGGASGGMGFRDYALPVIVYATDAYLRDPDSTNRTYNGSPGGCPMDAGFNAVVDAANDSGAKLIGIAVGNSTPVTQMNELADATGSLADTNGDGRANERLVFQWTGSSSTLRDTIVSAIQDLVSSVQFSEISLQVEGDDHGFVIGVDPEVVTLSDSAEGQTISFSLTFRGAVPASPEDQVYHLTLNVVGDGTVLLDTLDIYVLVPGY